MRQIKLQNTINSQCDYICRNKYCSRPAVLSINDRSYCGQHFRIIIQKLLEDYNQHIFIEKEKGWE